MALVTRGTTAFDDLILASILIVLVLIVIFVPFCTTVNTQLKEWAGMKPTDPTPWWWFVIGFVILWAAFYFAIHGF
jgi:hypothetical protein